MIGVGTPQELFVYECHAPKGGRFDSAVEGFIGSWPEPPYHYLFFDRDAEAQVSSHIATLPDWVLVTTYRMGYHQWQQAFTTEYNAGHFLISGPDGVAGGPDEAAGVSIKIDPGVVFGSGLHPTTRGCLELISEIPPRENGLAVDLGTGTGILALACASLGWRVLALDSNELAVRVARNNVALNKAEHTVHLVLSDSLNVLRAGIDLLVANIELPCLQSALGKACWDSFGTVVLSGFLETQEQRVMNLVPPGFSVWGKRNIDGWVSVGLSGPSYEPMKIKRGSKPDQGRTSERSKA